jgi:hypothetical protein
MIGFSPQLSDYVANVQEILHDISAVSWPLARVVSRINDARLHVAMDMHCVRQFQTQVQLIQGVEVYNMTGAVAGVVITAPGSNYTGSTVPITFSAAPAGGITATAIGTLTAGSLTAVTMTQWGQGYLAAPTVTVGGNGAGATANPVYISGLVQPVSITYLFNNIRNMLGFLPFTLFQAYMRVFATTAFVSTPAKWSFIPQIQNIFIQPPPNQTYISEWDLTVMPQVTLANPTDVDTDIQLPWSRAVEFKAAELLLWKHQNFAQVKALTAEYDAMVPRIVMGAGGTRIPNPYNRNYQRMVTR